MNFVYQTVNILADLISMLIVIRVLMTWFVQHPEQHRLSRFLVDATDPILVPIRRALPRMGMLDLSPIVAILLIEVLRSLLNNLL